MLFPQRPLPSSQLILLSFRATLTTLFNLLPWLILAVCIIGLLYFYNASQTISYDSYTHISALHDHHQFMMLGYPIIASLLFVWLLLFMLYQAQACLSNKPNARATVIQSTNKRWLRFLLCIIVTVIILFYLSKIILPYIFVFPIIIFVPITVAIDDYPFFTAFKHAWQLVWGNWWHTFIVLFLVLFMPMFIIAIITFACTYVIKQTDYVIAVTQTLMLLIILPLAVNTLLILYNDLRLRYNAQP